MYYVYVIKSKKFPNKIYVGYTINPSARIKKHNELGSVYTKSFAPWELVYFCAFTDKGKALKFEKYLKTYSGKAFMKKHLICQ